jgi:hypothetical protein
MRDQLSHHVPPVPACAVHYFDPETSVAYHNLERFQFLYNYLHLSGANFLCPPTQINYITSLMLGDPLASPILRTESGIGWDKTATVVCSGESMKVRYN